MVTLDENGFVALPPAYVKVDGVMVTNPEVFEAQRAAYFQYRTAYRTDSKGTRAVGRYNLDGSVTPYVRTLK
jgi:hypothetical protein